MGATPKMAAAAAVALSVALAGPALAASTVTVDEDDLGVGWHTADQRGAGAIAFTTVNGRSAVQLSTPGSGDKAQLFTSNHHGLGLAQITTLTYDTHKDPSSADGPALPSLNMRVDLDGDDDADTYLVYEPYQDDAFYGNAAVDEGVWQQWDAWHGGASQWWGSHLNNGQPFGAKLTEVTGAACGQSTPCSITVLLTAFPDAQVVEEPYSSINAGVVGTAPLHGSLGLNLGSGNAEQIGAVDTLTVNEVTYDFAPRVFDKADCKDGGWHANFAADTFVNQGDCVSFFASDGKTHR